MDSKKLNCPSCGQLAAQMKEDGSISHRQYDQLLQKLMELERQCDIELYAGDCPLEDTGAVLDAEQHYTICHYMRCRSCGALYFVGACIRGTPFSAGGRHQNGKSGHPAVGPVEPTTTEKRLKEASTWLL